MHELLSMTLVELSRALRRKEASPVDVMREAFAAVDAKNPALNAVVAERSRDDLLAEARVSEALLMKGEGGVLEGIPFGVKDLEDAVGLATTEGSVPLKNQFPSCDSTQVKRLKSAGAIVFGKTNTPEFGMNAITKNLLYGATRSPWDPERTPGGSSGGSAAALASEMLPLVTSSDGGGSIRIPASFVGAFGLKPSFGRVPRGPAAHWLHGATIVYGPLTKTVEDGALFLDVVAGYDAHDAMSLPDPGLSYRDVVARPLDRKLRIGFSPDLGYAVVQSDVVAAVEDGVRVFERLGHEVRLIEGGPPQMNGEWSLLTAFETAASVTRLRPAHDAEFGRNLVQAFRQVETMSPALFLTLMEKRAGIVAWCASVFADHDVLVTPTVPYDPPPARGPFPAETDGRRQLMAGVASFTIPFNFSWNPAATVRAGFSRAGFPIGLQIVGPHHRDDLVLQVARAFERERPAHPAWPMRTNR